MTQFSGGRASLNDAELRKIADTGNRDDWADRELAARAELLAALEGVWPSLNQLPGDVRWLYANEIEAAREALAKYGVQQ